MVSTRPDAAKGFAPSGMRHLDYYEHALGNPLFSNLKAANGIVTYGDERSYAVLYKTCNACDREIQNNAENPHHIARQVAQQMVQGFGGHAINTVSE